MNYNYVTVHLIILVLSRSLIYSSLDLQLIEAITLNQEQTVIDLLEAGANRDAVAKGFSALTTAIKFRRSSIAILLIQRGADINKAVAANDSALMCILRRSKIDMVPTLLIMHGTADISQQPLINNIETDHPIRETIKNYCDLEILANDAIIHKPDPKEYTLLIKQALDMGSYYTIRTFIIAGKSLEPARQFLLDLKGRGEVPELHRPAYKLLHKYFCLYDLLENRLQDREGNEIRTNAGVLLPPELIYEILSLVESPELNSLNL